MAISNRIWEFPALKVKSQLFHSPGAALDGGYTMGGARILSPEPGGRAVLELQLAFQVGEWDAPFFSWLMSKVNGEIFRIKLTKTPQIVTDAALGIVQTGISVPWAATGLMNESLWDNDQEWTKDGEPITVNVAALAGSSVIKIDMSGLNDAIQNGHVIGFGGYSHIVDEIEYNSGIATVSIKPPLRNGVLKNDTVYLRPFFTGVIGNPEEMRASYDAENIGYVQPGRIIFLEAIVNQ